MLSEHTCLVVVHTHYGKKTKHLLQHTHSHEYIRTHSHRGIIVMVLIRFGLSASNSERKRKQITAALHNVHNGLPTLYLRLWWRETTSRSVALLRNVGVWGSMCTCIQKNHKSNTDYYVLCIVCKNCKQLLYQLNKCFCVHD